MAHPQLPLNIFLSEHFRLDNFVAGSNQLTVDVLHDALAGNSIQPLIYIWGASQTGKTHLLQAFCHESSKQQQRAMYLPLNEFKTLDVSVLSNLQSMHTVCFDDIDAIVGNTQWEQALFHSFNELYERHVNLIFSAKSVVGAIGIVLEDLRSRLSWGLICKLNALVDDDKRFLLQLRAHQKGMQLSDQVASYLLRHAPRDVGALLDIIEKLDKASLASQRKLTIPFIKQVL